MTLATFHTLVKDTAKRGSTLDSYIPTMTKHAALWIERNFTLQYMKKYAALSLDPDSAQPRAISLPNSRFKAVRFFKILNTDGTYSFLQKVDPKDITATREAKPTAFWLDGVDFIWFDFTPSELLSAEIGYNEFSNWAALASGDTHWLLDHAEDLLLYQTLFQLAPFIRDPNLMAMYKPLRDEALRTVSLSDDEFEQGPARSEKMQYGRE